MIKKVLGAVMIIVSLSFGYRCYDGSALKAPVKERISEVSSSQRLEKQADSLKIFIAKNPEYNSAFVFLIDMKIMSGKNRFFVYDLKNNKVTDRGLVAHGSGSETGIEGQLKFSNVNNSRCTALGKYAVGNHYVGTFGKAYKLHGLEKTNNNAFARFIVLHSYRAVPYEEQQIPICNSLGCPMVNALFFKRIEKMLDSSEKKILLSIYY